MMNENQWKFYMLLLYILAIMCLSVTAGSQGHSPPPLINRSKNNYRTICRSIAGMTRDQYAVCQQHVDIMEVGVIAGIEASLQECQYQFRGHRWNCTTSMTFTEPSPRSRNQNTSNSARSNAVGRSRNTKGGGGGSGRPSLYNTMLLKKGYRESAFAYAIMSAGIAYSVTRACAQGHLISCGCETKRNTPTGIQKGQMPQDLNSNNKIIHGKTSNRWKWAGCSHNLEYGIDFSRLFLDVREKAGDLQSRINLHNNNAGRLVLSRNIQIRCKCHGMSGSCQLKTCWKTSPDFRLVGKILKDRFRSAVLVEQTNINSGSPFLTNKRTKNKKKRIKFLDNQNRRRRGQNSGRKSKKVKMEETLLYYQRSPSFCERDLSTGILGTSGRICIRGNETRTDTCDSLCCGRGYDVIKQVTIDQCHCKFNWCCTVECQECVNERWISVCK